MTPRDALLLVEPAALSQLLSPVFDPAEWKKLPVATRGLPASPGAASGQVVFHLRARGGMGRAGQEGAARPQGDPRRTTSTAWKSRRHPDRDRRHDLHAAVVGRQMGRPSVVGASALRIDEKAKVCAVGDQTLKEGDWLSFDGLTAR